MLKSIENVEEVLDFVYRLNMDDRYRGYAKKRTLEECISNLRQGVESNNSEVLACYREDEIKGVCVYYWDKDNNYAQTNNLVIEDDYKSIADEIFSYMEEKLKGYELLSPHIDSNIEVNKYMKESGWKCIDDLLMTRIFNTEEPKGEIDTHIEIVTQENFEEYGQFHDKHAIPLEMFYTSKNIKKALERFRVLQYRDKGKIVASIFTRVDGDIAEIFGAFCDDDCRGRGIESELVKGTLKDLYREYGSIKELLYFPDFDSKDDVDAALSNGFKNIGRSLCYKKVFK